MKVTIRTRHMTLSRQTTDEVRHRLDTAFDRISPWIHTLDVTIADINGPKGGADKRCRIRIRGRSIPSVVVEHVGVNTLATIAKAAEQAEQAVVRKLARRRVFAPLLVYRTRPAGT